MKKIIVIFLSFTLIGCAGLQTLSEYEKNVKDKVVVEFEGKTFLVQDDKSKSAALVTEDTATDFFKSAIEGLTLTLVDLTSSVINFEGAMGNYLSQYKSNQCEIKRSNFISDGMGGGVGYEIFYECLKEN